MTFFCMSWHLVRKVHMIFPFWSPHDQKEVAKKSAHVHFFNRLIGSSDQIPWKVVNNFRGHPRSFTKSPFKMMIGRLLLGWPMAYFQGLKIPGSIYSTWHLLLQGPYPFRQIVTKSAPLDDCVGPTVPASLAKRLQKPAGSSVEASSIASMNI